MSSLASGAFPPDFTPSFATVALNGEPKISVRQSRMMSSNGTSHFQSPRPSDPSATVCLEVYASFECQPMLGTGEQLRKLTVTVKQLLDCSEKHILFTFFPKDGDIASPCSSIVVTVERSDGESSDSLLDPFRSTTDAPDELEDTTNHGHSALSRYRKHGERRDLERSVAEFEQALNICALNHPCRAAAQSNLATAKFILCQVDDMSASFEIPIGLYRDALATRPVGHVDRLSTLVHLATVHLARFQKQGDKVDGALVEGLLHEAMGSWSWPCKWAIISGLEFRVTLHRRGPMELKCSAVEMFRTIRRSGRPSTSNHTFTKIGQIGFGFK
ncbi:hypothetical protein JVT61DRAFT_10630 [Boletus reticuloceps]|uniref:Uncharacterized protein n=1 Tax=Boletus reticuloceps TaxID=495285 RepID=A0A8I3A625_9AGAM|nr:hypothetical protein JVT61DRAFT_10630 [Boletus reticuloceps]